MKKILLALALVGLLGSAAPALACEGGKCTMQYTEKDGGKKKKSKKAAAKAESCHMNKETATATGATKSCCAKPEAGKAEAAKEEKKAQ
ncbi:hypothetical protein [Pontibacter cellulosilyticus]|uniref:Uncharacterized protein n=1 Tax=Pontibacter cellulosilyticus TaxID=1720253 RepID=A0A923N4K0_9BACT|nr:hypothetical protein [Pontibacter cellulosilyticus]MBC5991739.1 hypothetical protein [Pontibacter cellulosilyticus]